VLYVIKYRIDFKLGILIKEAPSIGEAYIRDRKKRCYC
jgi:hypothetical protein